jgi:uncharacterized protein (DUF1501 family)
MWNQLSRRQFMRFGAGLGLSAAGAAVLERLCLTQAWAQTQTDYKALVCIFFAGGNDANQLLVPLSGATGFGSADVTGGYPAYSAERSGQGLAIAAPPATGTETATQLLRINPGSNNPNLGTFGLHPKLGGGGGGGTATFNSGSPVYPATTPPTNVTVQIPSFKSLYDSGQAAIVCNVGTLFKPLSKSDYQASGNNRPSQLFSHSDQVRENQTCVFTVSYPSGVPGGTGWGGRIADKVTLNGTSSFPMQLSVSGSPQFMSGANTFPIAVSPAPTALNQVLVLNGFGTAADEVKRRQMFDHLRAINMGTNKLVDANSLIMTDALAAVAALSTDPHLTVPDPTTSGRNLDLTFPNTTLGNQLKQVAKVIKANLQQSALALKRQIFFCQVGGFDTHQGEQPNGAGNDNGQPGLLRQYNEAVATFFYWLKNNAPASGEPTLGDLTGKVTSFVMSDFSRTFNPSGTSGPTLGTDHAWGSHWPVLGGSVNGGQLYGVPLPGGNGTVYPTLSKGTNSAYDVDNSGGRGRWIPSVSTLQYANTLAAWYGLPQTTETGNALDYVFPLLRANFATTNLGFV